MEFLNGVNKSTDSKYGRYEFWVVISFPFQQVLQAMDWLYANKNKAKQQ